MAALVDETGNVYGRLTVLRRGPGYISPGGAREVRWACRCSCGAETLVQGAALRSDHTQSCGCLSAELFVERARERAVEQRGPFSPTWKGDDAGYAAAHDRVTTFHEGPATDHGCVHDCGRQAWHWSYNGGDPDARVETSGPCAGLAYSLDLSFYAPRCRSCHKLHDRAMKGAIA